MSNVRPDPLSFRAGEVFASVTVTIEDDRQN